MKKRRVISGKNVPKSFLPFSPGILCGQFVFISGQASVDLEGNVISGSFEEECRRSFENLKAVLEGVGLGLKDIVQVRNYVKEPQDLPLFNKIYREYFEEPFPARTTLTGCLNKLKFEVDAIAYY